MLNCLIEVAPIWVMYFPTSEYLRIRWFKDKKFLFGLAPNPSQFPGIFIH